VPAARTRRTPPPSETPDIETEEKRERTAKMGKLQVAVESAYALLAGLFVTVPGPLGQKLKPIGSSLKNATPEIAEAWIDLAEDDPRVRKALESLTSISGWGKLVGLHLFAIGGGIPGVAAMQQMAQQQGSTGEGASDIEALTALAKFMAESAAQQRTGNGAEEPPPMPQQPPPQQRPRQQRQEPQSQPPQQPQPSATTMRPAAGIPTPQELGVQVPDQPMDFPSGSAQDVKGK